MVAELFSDGTWQEDGGWRDVKRMDKSVSLTLEKIDCFFSVSISADHCPVQYQDQKDTFPLRSSAF